jgi:hypothetical protein
MDEEDIEAQPPPQMPAIMRVTAITMTGEFILVFGVIFILLGASQFVTDLLKIKGSGEVLVGLALCGVAMALFAISRREMPKIMPRPPQAPKPQKAEAKDQSAYR